MYNLKELHDKKTRGNGARDAQAAQDNRIPTDIADTKIPDASGAVDINAN